MLALIRSTAPTSLRRVYAVSDLHTDYEENLAWVDALQEDQQGVLLVAGDVSDKLDRFVRTMESLVNKYALVFFTPGNHDLWLRRDGSEGADSLQKMQRLESACDALGVLTTPQRLNMEIGRTLSILPLLSFYHESFDTEPAVTALRLPSVRRVMADYRACSWPAPLSMGGEDLAGHIDAMNDVQLARAATQAEGRDFIQPIESWDGARQGGASVVSFSHFLPRIELIPEKR